MLKSFLLFAAVVLLVLASASAPARSPQDAAKASGANSGAKQSPKHTPRPRSFTSMIVRFAMVQPEMARLIWPRICN